MTPRWIVNLYIFYIYIYIIKSKEIIVKNIGGLTINQPVEMDSG